MVFDGFSGITESCWFNYRSQQKGLPKAALVSWLIGQPRLIGNQSAVRPNIHRSGRTRPNSKH